METQQDAWVIEKGEEESPQAPPEGEQSAVLLPPPMPGEVTSEPQAAEEVASEPQAQKYTCPSCGREFDTQQGLSMHVARTHGLSKPGKASSKRKASNKRPGGSARRAKAPEFDPNALLASVFPSGIPPNAETLRRASSLVYEAEALSKRR